MHDLVEEYHELLNDIFYKCEQAGNSCTDLYNRGFTSLAEGYAIEHHAYIAIIEDNGLQSRYANYLKPQRKEDV